ncbi:hypothetical protein SNE40_002158 [Patella caerulea]|uniref:VWFA domain-containing protein n=1 Tax=Patella caerulea TaxID=87958 RepID=A0AAN8K7Z5_PATCE
MVCRLFLVFLMGFLSIRADDSDDGPPVPAQVSTPRCKSLLDVVAVVDGSDSIGADEFGQLKSALESLVTDLNVKPDNTHLGIILFSANITHKIELSGDAANLISKIRSLEHPRDGTNTALAIEEMNGMVSRLRRPEAPIVGIVITDGISKDPISTAQQAVVSRDMGINMVAIGVGTKVDELELQSIASNGQVLTTAHFNQIGAILGNLVQVACPSE